ncbi:alpha/beta hydrolase [Petropleomorpha daqingensis]|uniref:Acetyl esterase/lipase n=1 Tax=Petropleomorpha daqingensis TaxID=2026353 RepID=A0A853CK02_9ACTN|nr:alpha/beta hydrolase [Petropleomorpha daqingensis]NYJ07209.1 acetyl esterase/lipase [Petropleomorpha daqingensis]
MPLHPHLASNLHLLDGMTSIEAALADPQQAPRLAQFMSVGEAAPCPEVLTRDLEAPGPHGPVRVRVYTPVEGDGSPARPGLVWVHGGGFRMGNLDDAPIDGLVREFCVRADAVVVSVDYRLAVDGVAYPVPHDDVVAALRWVRANADAVGIDPTRLSAGGDSAGGNLVAGAALRVRDEDAWTPAALLLVYPVLHPVVPPLSPGLAAAAATLPDLLRFLPSDVAEMNRNYLGGPETTADGYAMPGLAVLDGLPPTLVVNAEYDDLRASGEAFVASLALAGVDVRQVCAPGMLHGFLMLPDSIEPAGRTRQLLADTICDARSAAPSAVALEQAVG